MTRVLVTLVLLGAITAGSAVAAPRSQQPPSPRPYPGTGQQPATTPARPASQEAVKPAEQPTPPPVAGESTEVPTEATLGLPIYPSAQYLTSYDAGKGQRFCLFGTTATFADVVNYYKSMLKQKGDLVFEEPPTHAFEVGRYKEETIGFPPGVTVKDYTWGGLGGYMNPKPDAEPASFATVIQIVAVPASARTGTNR